MKNSEIGQEIPALSSNYYRLVFTKQRDQKFGEYQLPIPTRFSVGKWQHLLLKLAP